jgi:hypothetical protein
MNHLIVLIVDDMNHYLAVLEAWDRVGISNVTIHTLTSLDHAEHSGLRDDLPLLPSLQHFLTGNKKPCHVLLATTDSHEHVEKMVASAQEVLDNPKHSGEGTLFVLPIIQALSWTKKQVGSLANRRNNRKIFSMLALLPAFSLMDGLVPVTNLLCY